MSRLSSRLFRTAALSSAVAGLAAFATLAPITSAHALTMKECSAKYKAAQDSRHAQRHEVERLPQGAMRRGRFRRGDACDHDDGSKPAPRRQACGSEEQQPRRRPRPPRRRTPCSRTPCRPKYSKESAGKARMHTCLDQYNANKASNGNGGLKWIQKGGGYYSECNKRLKG